MQPIPEDQIAAHLLSIKWAAVKNAKSEAEKTESENQITLFFKSRLQAAPPESVSSTFLAPVQHLKMADADKIEIYEIGARILFGSVCLSSTQNEIHDAIHQKMHAPKSIERLAKELNTAFDSLALLPESEKTSSMISKVMTFFGGLEGRFLEQILNELKEFPMELRAIYFQVRRTKDLVDALNQIKTDKIEALKTLIPTMKALTDECGRHKFIHVLKLIPEAQRNGCIKVLAKIIIGIPSQVQLRDFVATVEHEMNPDERGHFLRRFEPLLLQKDFVGELFLALQACASYINLKGTTPITPSRLILWKELKPIMIVGSPSEKNRIEKSIKEIPDNEIDDFCRDVIPHSNRLSLYYRRLMIADLYTIFSKETRSQAVPKLLDIFEALNILSSEDFGAILVLLMSLPNDQKFTILPYMTELYKGYVPDKEHSTYITSVIISLTSVGLHTKEQFQEIFQTVVRLRKELNTHPAILIAAVELLPYNQVRACTAQNRLLQAHISIFEGVSLEWLSKLSEGVSEKNEDAILYVGSVCKEMLNAGARLNLLGILSQFPTDMYPRAFEKYAKCISSAKVKNESIYTFTLSIYNNFLTKIALSERLDAIEHIGILFDDEEYLVLPAHAPTGVEASIAGLMELFSQFSINLGGQHSIRNVLNNIPPQNIAKIFKYASLLCGDLRKDKSKILQASCKVSAEELKDIVEHILPYLSGLNGSNRAKCIEELAKNPSARRAELAKAMADPMNSPSMR